MTTANFGGDGQQKTVEQLDCSSGLSAGLHGHLIFLSVLNSFLSVTAFLGNALILIALHKESSLHPPSKLLLRSLATTDLFVGLFSEPLAVIYWISMASENENWSIRHYTLAVGLLVGNVLSGLSLMTMTVISVDRLLALLLGLRYRHVVTLKRTYVIVITLWVVSVIFSAVQLRNRLITIWCGIIVTSLCLVISVFSYSKIFLTLRHHQIKYKTMFNNRTKQIN